MQEINFKRPRKGKLPEEPKTSQNIVQHLSVRSAVGIPAEKLAELRELSPNAAIFTSLPSSERKSQHLIMTQLQLRKIKIAFFQNH